MTESIEHQMTEIYCFVDDDLKAHPRQAQWRRPPHCAPRFANAEVITIALLQGSFQVPSLAERWRDLAELLVVELKIAASRTTVSSVPAFLTEHLRRRLWKKDKAQLDREEKQTPPAEPQVDASKCLDCGGSGWYYPDGQERGVAKCKHVKPQGES